jgi:hypothetical protein
MINQLNGRPYSLEKTGIDDLEKLKKVKQSLVKSEGLDRLKDRARKRRQFTDKPITRPAVAPTQEKRPIINSLYRVNGYNPDTDLWQVESVSKPGEVFSAKTIKAGGLSVGTIVRGYNPTAIEPQPQGRRFKPIEQTITRKKEEITIRIQIGYTGKI